MNKRIPTLTMFQKLALCLFIALLSPVVIFFIPSLHSDAARQQVTLAWDRCSNKDLAGYRVFCREKDQGYDYGAPAWEAEIDEQDKLPNPDEPTCTIYDLDEDTTYYFVARAFYTSGNESGDSNEVCITIFSETYEVSGRITAGGDGVDGVTVEPTRELSECGTTNNPTITSGGGYYSLDVPDGNYTVTPSLSSYDFTPLYRDVTVNGTDVPDQDFTAIWTGVIDDPDGTLTGSWGTSSWAPGYYGTNYHYNAPGGSGTDTFTWALTVPSAGTYEVFARWTNSGADPDTSRADDANYAIYHDGVSTPVSVDQQYNGGEWVSLGTYSFDGVDDYVELSDSPNGYVIADAIKIEMVHPGDIDIMEISGQILDEGESGVDSATVELTGSMTDSTTTSGGGYYSFNVTQDGSYTVTPSLAGYEFSPSSRPVTLSGADAVDQDFTAILSGSTDIIVDNPDGSPAGSWGTSSWSPDYYGTNYHYHQAGSGTDTFTWTPVIPTAGTYEVFAWWCEDPSRAPDATYTIYHDGGITDKAMDQRSNGGQWVSLGIFSFDGTGDYVELTQSPGGYVIADAVKWELQP